MHGVYSCCDMYGHADGLHVLLSACMSVLLALQPTRVLSYCCDAPGVQDQGLWGH
jgi:hypothetical protein